MYCTAVYDVQNFVCHVVMCYVELELLRSRGHNLVVFFLGNFFFFLTKKNPLCRETNCQKPCATLRWSAVPLGGAGSHFVWLPMKHRGHWSSGTLEIRGGNSSISRAPWLILAVIKSLESRINLGIPCKDSAGLHPCGWCVSLTGPYWGSADWFWLCTSCPIIDIWGWIKWFMIHRYVLI